MPFSDDTYACPCTHNHEPTLLSFEVIPLRRSSLEEPFWNTVGQLLRMCPDFMSVIYGAGGKGRSNVRLTAHRLVRDTPIQPTAYPACVGGSTEEVASTVYDYLDFGARTSLALHGDPSVGQGGWESGPGGIGSATGLIHLIRTIEKRRYDVHPGKALRSTFKPLTIAVVVLPAGNPTAGTTSAQEAERLLARQTAGASLAITQLFWGAGVYVSFVECVRRAGITVPIVLSLLSVTDSTRLRRVQDPAGIEAPEYLLMALADYPRQDARNGSGAVFGSRLIHSILETGVPGIHLYTFNHSKPALDILALAGAKPDPLRSQASSSEIRV